MSTQRSANPLFAALKCTRKGWVHAVVFSVLINMLMLTGTIYMVEVYDRVLASRSLVTLAALSVAALLAYVLYGWLDHLRGRLMTRMGASIDAELSPYGLRAALLASAQRLGPADALRTANDIATVRAFLAGAGPIAIMDLPFTPVLIVACFFLHPWLGVLALTGACLVIGLMLLTEFRSRRPGAAVANSMAEQAALLETGIRNRETLAALGMRDNFIDDLHAVHRDTVADSLRLAETSGAISAWAKTLRHVLQSAVLALGAWLVLRGEMSGGLMLAASVLSTKALQPIEAAVAQMKGFVSVRQSLHRLNDMLPRLAIVPHTMELPMPSRSLTVEDVAVVAPGRRQTLVSRASFHLEAGQACALIGPSGAGKSSLLRAIVGVHPVARGAIRIDGAMLHQWRPEALGRAIGYLPQDTDVLDGTVAQNIARLDATPVPEAVIAAAKAAGIHEMVMAMPDGYDTRLSRRGHPLSGGQRQRLAFARAMFGDPFLVIMDEPNAHLDEAGEIALGAAIRAIKARGGIVLMITHRASGLADVDSVAVMEAGQMIDFGARDRMLATHRRFLPPVRQPSLETTLETTPDEAPSGAEPADLASEAEQQMQAAFDLRQMAAHMRQKMPVVPAPAAAIAGSGSP